MSNVLKAQYLQGAAQMHDNAELRKNRSWMFRCLWRKL